MRVLKLGDGWSQHPCPTATMPIFTPSRLAIIVLSSSLVILLWTFGLSRPLAAPALPIIDHHGQEIASTVTLPSTTPYTHTTAHRSIAPGATSVPEHDKDGVRWKDRMNGTVSEPYKETIQPPTHGVADFCKDAPGARHIMVVMKTSKAEIKSRLPTHLESLLECVPNFAIFSDHSGEINGYTVHNALEPISGDTKRNYEEFHEYQLMHADTEHEPDMAKTKALDKWKFLPMVYQAYHLRPSARFFIFIEADTSLSWTNLLQWAGRLDYRIPYHSGAPTYMGGVQIAQRGSGILLSQAAMRRYAKSYDELYESKWEPQVAKECCGDLLLTKALNDAHVELYTSWPMLQTEQPSTLDYTKKIWCSPAISWHHVLGDDLKGMWENEKKWVAAKGWKEPYLYRDAFADYVASHMEAQKVDWDNLSTDTKIVAPQGRQKQLKEEEERKKKHEEEEAEKKKHEVEAEREKTEQGKQDEEKSPESLRPSEETAEDEKKPTSTQTIPAPTDTSTTVSSPSPPPHQNRAPAPADDNDNQPPNWDKLTSLFLNAGDSAARCQKACIDVPDCLQWRYTTFGDGECHLGKVLRLGAKKAPKSDVKWTSGWLVERTGKVTKDWKCKKPQWKFYQ